MPAMTPYIKNINPNKGEPRAQAPRYFFNTYGRGVARKDDVVRTRLLETSFAVALPLNIIKTQIAGTGWSVTPDEEYNEDPKYLEACEEIERWLNGRFNVNQQSWDAFLNAYASDILSIGNGVAEKVWNPDRPGEISQIFARDAGVFTKNVDDFGRLPGPEDEDPAYYQWAGSTMSGVFQQNTDSRYLLEHASTDNPYMYRISNSQPIEFQRNDLMWTDLNARTYDVYSRGIVSDAAVLAEIALNALLVNRKSFQADEVPEGILAIQGAGPNQVQQVIDYWQSSVRGNAHKLPIIGAPEGVEYKPFRGSMKELQYLESQKWYVKMIWMLFGLNANEVGDIAEVTRPGGSKQFSVDVWRKTTMPLLSKIEHDINRQLLPSTSPFQRLGGNISFQFKISHPDAEEQMRQQQRDDLDKGLLTLNEALIERGEDPVSWGDMPYQLYQTLIDRHPEWFFDEFVEMDNKPESPEPPSQGGDIFGLQRVPEQEGKGIEQKPFGPWEDFDDCVQHMMSEEGYNEETARKVCGKLQEELEGQSFRGPMKHKAEDLEDIEEEDFNNDKKLYQIGKELRDDTKKIIQSELEQIKSAIQDNWSKSIKVGATAALPIADILRGIGLGSVLEERVGEAQQDIIEIQFLEQSKEIENRIQEETGADIEFKPPPADEESSAMKRMRERAKKQMMSVEQDVREQIETVLSNAVDEGWQIQEITEQLDDRIETISTAKSRLISRTEVMSSKREATQMLAEGTDLIDRKMWDATKDRRTREWHRAMNGVVVPKNEKFTVPGGFKDQPSNYPRDTMVVGGDQPFNCFDKKTEILTEYGWKRFTELDNERVYTYNMDSENLELQCPNRHVKKWEKTLYAYKNKSIDLLCTGDHELVIRQDGKNIKKSVKYILENIKTHISIPAITKGLNISKSPEFYVIPKISGQYEYQDKLYGDRWGEKKIPIKYWARFLGIYLAEGFTSTSNKNYSTRISATKLEQRKLVKSLIKKMGYRPNDCHKDLIIVENKQLALETKPLSKGAKNKTIPDYVFSWDINIIEEFLKWYAIGDGNEADYGAMRIWTISKKMADQLQRLYIQIGKHASILKTNRNSMIINSVKCNANDLYCIQERLSKHRCMDFRNKEFKKVKYNDNTYCVTVPNGTIIVRRNKKPLIIGNCRCDQRHVLADDLPKSAKAIMEKYQYVSIKK